MSEMIELSLTDLHAETSGELYTESLAADITKSGTYVARVVKVYPKRNPEDSDFNPGRSFASLQIQLFDPEDVTVKKGQFFGKVSWEKRLTRNGKLDNQCRHYAELMRAVGAKPTDSVAEVLTASTETMFLITVDETYRVTPSDVHPSHMDQVRDASATDAWIRVQAEENEEREHYLSNGFESMLMIKRIKPLA